MNENQPGDPGVVECPCCGELVLILDLLSLQAEVERKDRALGFIKTHAQLDLDERGVAEARRYVALADDGLNPEGTEG